MNLNLNLILNSGFSSHIALIVLLSTMQSEHMVDHLFIRPSTQSVTTLALGFHIGEGIVNMPP